jgi:DNA-nicking Smr family endonuclease
MTRKTREAPDHALWEEVKRSILPLLRQPQSKAAVTNAGKPIVPFSGRAVPSAVIDILPNRRVAQDHAPPLAQLDRRTAQRLGRGQIEPEARLDLHGENLETARMKLLHFLSSERQHGVRFALVITGKGASPFARHTLHGTTHFHTPEREGRLRREVPLWLHEDGFRRHVVAFQPAHPKHGGGGAFYVRLRKLAQSE